MQAEGLVDILPQRGSTVSLVRIADVLEYMLIRKALEAEAVRVVTGNPSPELVETLQRNMSYQRAAAERAVASAAHNGGGGEFDSLFREALAALSK